MAISKKLKDLAFQESGEFRNNGNITFFPGPYRAPIGFFHVWEKNPG
jgi:hypothetical protein